MSLLRPVLCCVLLAAAGCKTVASKEGEPSYANDAETNLKKGDESLAGHDYTEAERYYEYVRVKYPFLEAAKDAELRLADTAFEREEYADARDRYQSFA